MTYNKIRHLLEESKLGKNSKYPGFKVAVPVLKSIGDIETVGVNLCLDILNRELRKLFIEIALDAVENESGMVNIQNLKKYINRELSFKNLSKKVAEIKE